jgi:hypothetical protein
MLSPPDARKHPADERGGGRPGRSPRPAQTRRDQFGFSALPQPACWQRCFCPRGRPRPHAAYCRLACPGYVSIRLFKVGVRTCPGPRGSRARSTPRQAAAAAAAGVDRGRAVVEQTTGRAEVAGSITSAITGKARSVGTAVSKGALSTVGSTVSAAVGVGCSFLIGRALLLLVSR